MCSDAAIKFSKVLCSCADEALLEAKYISTISSRTE